MTKAQEQIARGKRIEYLLDDEDFQNSIEQIERSLMNEWRTTAPENNDRREEIYYELRGLKTLLDALKGEKNKGILATNQSETDTKG